MSIDQKTQELIKLAIEESIEGLQIISRDWRYIYVNAAVAKQGRKTKEELIGRTMMECYPGIDHTSVFEEFKYVMQTGETRRVENEFVYEDGKKCWFELWIEPHQNGILIHSIDITDRKKIEEQYRHAQKMDAIGRLAGGIAHDFNNKLGIMLAYCDMALNEVQGKDARIENYVKKILAAVKQSSSLTRQLLAFSRKQVFDMKVINLNQFLSDSKNSLSKLIGEGIDIQCFFDKELGNIRVDPSQLDQVILNLCINARDAMPGGGSLTIETKNVYLDQAYAHSHPDVTPGSYVMLSCSDTGCGMDKEVMSRIFEPFFTTKERGRGTGLGLSTVHGIIKQSKGHIWVYSEPHRGTVFKIYFPRVDEGVDQSAQSQPTEVSFKGDETILLTEDDPLLREVYELALKGAGYQVLAAADPKEAEKIFEANKNKISLLLTDVILPKMNGRELAELLKKGNPDLKVVYMSGYTENSIVHQGILDTDSVLLQKPITVRNLLETIRGVLDGVLKKGVF